MGKSDHSQRIEQQVTRISRRRHHHSLNNLKHNSLTIRRNIDTFIHVRIKPSQSNQLNNNKSIKLNPKLSTISTVSIIRNHQNQSKQISNNENSIKSPSLMSMEKSYRDSSLYGQGRIETQTNRKGIINDHHRNLHNNKKIKCPRRYIIISIIVALSLILSITLTAILIAVLYKQTTSTTNTTVSLRWQSTSITLVGADSRGNASDMLSGPWDLGFDSSAALYTTDRYNKRVQKYLTNISYGITVTKLPNGTTTSSPSAFNEPTGLIVDSNGNLYISNRGNHRVIYWPNGASIGSIVAGNVTAGNSSNHLRYPMGIAYDSSSNVLYVADSGNHRVMSYRTGSTAGTLVAGGNGNGTSSTQLFDPFGVYFDSLSNSLIIANTGAHNIVRWVLGDNSWTHIAGNINGSSGQGSTSFNGPSIVTLDPMGNIYVADRFNHRIQLFIVGQSESITIAGVTGIAGNSSNLTLLNGPSSVILDSQLNLYVASHWGHRIQKFLRY